MKCLPACWLQRSLGSARFRSSHSFAGHFEPFLDFCFARINICHPNSWLCLCLSFEMCRIACFLLASVFHFRHFSFVSFILRFFSFNLFCKCLNFWCEKATKCQTDVWFYDKIHNNFRMQISIGSAKCAFFPIVFALIASFHRVTSFRFLHLFLSLSLFLSGEKENIKIEIVVWKITCFNAFRVTRQNKKIIKIETSL